MNQELKTIKLYGQLGRMFGKVHKLAVKDAAEAIRLLSANYPNFERYLIDSRLKNIGFSIFIGNENVNCKSCELGNRLREPIGASVIKIIPAVMGAKSGIGQLFAGLAVVFASVFTFGAAAIAAGSTAGIMSAGAGVFAAGGLAGAVANIGVAMALGGLAQIISPTKKGLSTADSPDNGASYNFNGAVNTTYKDMFFMVSKSIFYLLKTMVCGVNGYISSYHKIALNGLFIGSFLVGRMDYGKSKKRPYSY